MIIVGYYILRKNMKSKKYRIFLSFSKHPTKLFKLKIEFKDIEMKNEFLRYMNMDSYIIPKIIPKKYDDDKMLSIIFERDFVEKCIHQIQSFLWWRNYLTIVHLNKNKIGGMFMMEELK